MFFKLKFKKNKNTDNQNLKTGNPAEPNFENFNYEAIKFNEFLTDDVDNSKKKKSKDAKISSHDESSINDINISPLGKRLADDDQVMKIMNDTVKNNLSLDRTYYNSNDVAYSEVLTQTPVEDQYIISDDTKSFLKNQNTKVLLPDDIDVMIKNISEITHDASAILYDVERITKQLSPSDEIKTPFTKEFMSSKQSDDISIANNGLGIDRLEKFSNTNKLEEIKSNKTSKFKTKALFNDAGTQQDIENLDDLKPVLKAKEPLRITKFNKRNW